MSRALAERRDGAEVRPEACPPRTRSIIGPTQSPFQRGTRYVAPPAPSGRSEESGTDQILSVTKPTSSDDGARQQDVN